MINVLGADHHGYTGRMYALFAALGEAGRLEVIIMQLVHFVERGERAKMSKRRGDFVTLDELLDDIGVDAARFFMVERSLTRRSTSTSTWRASAARRTRSTTSSTRMRASPASCATPARSGWRARCARTSRAGARRSSPPSARCVKRVLELPGEVLVAARAAGAAPPHGLCA